MKKSDIKRLSYIAPIANLESILRYGILSHERAQPFGPATFALDGPQSHRARRVVAAGRTVHYYANLFINPRNVVMYTAIHDRGYSTLCVVDVSRRVLDKGGLIVSDQNAAASDARFYSLADGLDALEAEMVFARRWTVDGVRDDRVKKTMCAELFVPGLVPPALIESVRVSHESSLRSADRAVQAAELEDVKVRIDRDVFFLDEFDAGSPDVLLAGLNDDIPF